MPKRWPLALAALGTPALAQGGQGVGTWLFDVTTQNADAIVEPGETAIAEIAFWARLANGTVFGPEIAKASAFGDTPDIPFVECVRWGDYFDIELDPLDSSCWLTGMYMKSGGQFGELWGTRVRRAEAD